MSSSEGRKQSHAELESIVDILMKNVILKNKVLEKIRMNRALSNQTIFDDIKKKQTKTRKK